LANLGAAGEHTNSLEAATSTSTCVPYEHNPSENRDRFLGRSVQSNYAID
jgi:hypothetical protein